MTTPNPPPRSHLSAASSISKGLLVAPTTSTRDSDPCPPPPPVSSPSTEEKNSFLILRSAECSPELRALSRESISSGKGGRKEASFIYKKRLNGKEKVVLQKKYF